MDATGYIESYDASKGQGFIQLDDDEDETVPFDEVAEGMTVKEGDRVRFDVVGGMAGRMAKNVRPINPASSSSA